jgi:chemotaxis signal transduction protein
MLASPLAKHMSSVEDYRQRLAVLQSAWDTLTMLSHLNGDGTDMGTTRQAFETLAADLVRKLADETHHKALLGLKSKSQIAIDVLVRNLFERTADIGFLSTDDDIREFVAHRHDAEREGADNELRRRFREYVAKYSVYDDVVLLAPDGEVLLRLNDANTITHCTDPFVATTLATRAGYVETFANSSLFPDGANKLIYSHRVACDARSVGVLCLCFKLADEVAGIFAKLRDESDWTVFGFLDAQGRVLSSSDHWQMPLGASLPLALDQNGGIIRFAGREYLAVTSRTQGYQGYMGPGWYGHAMIPLEHAFERTASNASVSERMLAELRESPTIFSAELRSIPNKADQIQRELNRAVWNGNVRLAQRAATNTHFAKVLLREIGNAGRRTQETFEHSMGDLQRTVVSAILDDARQLASLAVDILDRNLYERANDCRWWALNASLIAHVEHGEPAREQTSAILQHINSLYTVYHDIVLFDANRRICAVSNPTHAKRISETITEKWAQATLSLRGSQDFAVSAFEPSSIYRNEHAFIFGAAVRNDAGRTVGGIGIVFDTKPQLAAMLSDALPRNQDREILPGCFGVFVDRDMRVVATSANHTIGAKIDLPANLADRQIAHLIEHEGSNYAAGACPASGYREFAGLGLTAIVLIPLGPIRKSVAAPVRVTRQEKHRHTSAGEQMLDIATFRSGQQWLGLLRDQVVESVDGSSLRAVPGAPTWHAGLLMYQGVPLPVIDLSRMIDKGAATSGRDVIIARTSGESPMVGLLIDDLDDIPEIAANRILPVADIAQRNGPKIVDRAVRPNQPEDPVLFLVNLEQVLMLARAVSNTTTAQRITT